MIGKIGEADVGRRVRYRPAPSANETLEGVLVRIAKRSKEPAAIVQFDGRDYTNVIYLKQLEFADG